MQKGIFARHQENTDYFFLKGGTAMLKELPQNPSKPLSECTIEDVKEAFELGYDAVIMDGKLIGFTKAV